MALRKAAETSCRALLSQQAVIEAPSPAQLLSAWEAAAVPAQLALAGRLGEASQHASTSDSTSQQRELPLAALLPRPLTAGTDCHGALASQRAANELCSAALQQRSLLLSHVAASFGSPGFSVPLALVSSAGSCTRRSLSQLCNANSRSSVAGVPVRLPGIADAYARHYGRHNSWHSYRAFSHMPSPWQAATPGTSASSDSDERHKGSTGQQHKEVHTVAEYKPAAAMCDEAIGTLRETYSRSQLANAPTFAGVAGKAFNAVAAGARALLGFLASVPGRLQRFAALSSKERGEVYRGWWVAIKKEARHYWVGSKLLVADVQVASRLVRKVLQGKQLSRRERRQLTRTSADVFRLVPFAIFVIVPFMELLLPVALKLFPNMLPSTFEDKLKREEELKKKVNARLEVARFLQDTVAEMAKDLGKNTSGAMAASAKELYQFMKRVRAGEPVSNYEIMRFAQLFNDELTLDNLERIHLVNLCRFVGISPFGTDAFLVARLRTHLANIKNDDRAIKDEGIDSLSEEELRSACRARGMRTPYGEGAVPFMRRQLAEWLDLSLNRALPSSLLLLSRAFTMTQPLAAPGGKEAQYQGLKDTLSSLPNKVIAEVSAEAPAAGADAAAELERKLERLRREEELIREEELEAEALLSHSEPTLQPGQTAPEMAAAAAAAAVVREAAASVVGDMALEGESEEERSAKIAAAKEEKMRKVLSALAVLASSSGVSGERQAFMQLVGKEVDRLNSRLAQRGAVNMVFHAGGIKVERPQSEQPAPVGHKRLEDKVTAILERIEAELDHVESKIGERMHVLDVDNDGLISKEELETALGFLRQQMGEDELRMLLERLNAFGQGDPDKPTINVADLMGMARDGAQRPAGSAAAAPAPPNVSDGTDAAGQPKRAAQASA